MSEACVWVNDYWFETLGFGVLRVSKAVGNSTSRRISEKQGMRLVGWGKGLCQRAADLGDLGDHGGGVAGVEGAQHFRPAKLAQCADGEAGSGTGFAPGGKTRSRSMRRSVETTISMRRPRGSSITTSPASRDAAFNLGHQAAEGSGIVGLAQLDGLTDEV